MRGPPDHSSERAPLAGRPISQKSLPCIADSTETIPELQARSLRRRFALGYYFAATVAPLIWGLPR
jgi:hypothetical protein